MGIKRKWAVRLVIWGFLASTVLVALVSCTPLKAYRTTDNPALACTPDNDGDPNSDQFGTVDKHCGELITENRNGNAEPAGYALHFVEFDDQGQLFPAERENLASKQMEHFLDSVRGKDGHPRELSSVVVFIHGWKHNAETDDTNVRWFREMLDRIAIVEDNAKCKRDVIGLYVGWRGDATSLPDVFKDLTFWTRKKAAGRVAEGQVRELLSRLRAVQDVRNAEWNRIADASNGDPATAKTAREDVTCKKTMRLTIVGHSFGGLITYNALAPSLIRDMADLNERIRSAKDASVDPVLPREGDLIVTINPAVEASAFVPLHLAAKAAKPHSYHSPVFVSITSADDKATGMAFPAARFFNTLLNNYPSGASDERDAALETIGHDQAVVDYTLNTLSVLNGAHPKTPLVADPECQSLPAGSTFNARFVVEMNRLQAFAQSIGESRNANTPPNADQKYHDLFPRQFCIHPRAGDANVAMALEPRPGVNLNSPIWNVYTAKPVLNDHSDLLNPDLIDFLRQLYEEGTRPDLERVRALLPANQ